MQGSHALGHTRMATESARDDRALAPVLDRARPLPGPQRLALQPQRLRRWLRREGIRFETDNDSEVAAGYLTWRMREGATLEQALEGCLEDLDGFYTFAVGTADGFAVLRDPIACKPAVMAETDDWVAMASEYRAIAVLPGAERAPRLGARARARLQLGTGAGLKRDRPGGHPAARAERRAARSRRRRTRRWRVLNPRGAHALAAGIDAPIEVEIEGHAGYYCAGMNKQATVRVHGNAGVGRGREHHVRQRGRRRQRQPVGRRDRPRRARRRSAATPRPAAGSR